MISLAHIVNPFEAEPSSDLSWTQPITFASMERAQEKARGKVPVGLFSAQFSADRSMVPDFFRKTPDLTRSVRDRHDFRQPVPLPILADILERLFQESTATHLIFTNVDIILHEHFYLRVHELIQRGHDAFIINRRRIPPRFRTAAQLEDIFKERGKSHPGFDCFVFKRELFPKFSLAEVCTGVPFIGITLAQNLFCFADAPQVFEEEFITFHLGMEIFAKRAPKEYFSYNQQQFWKAMASIHSKLDSRKWPYGQEALISRFWKWGWHPSLPIRLAMQLEQRRWFKGRD